MVQRRPRNMVEWKPRGEGGWAGMAEMVVNSRRRSGACWSGVATLVSLAISGSLFGADEASSYQTKQRKQRRTHRRGAEYAEKERPEGGAEVCENRPPSGGVSGLERRGPAGHAGGHRAGLGVIERDAAALEGAAEGAVELHVGVGEIDAGAHFGALGGGQVALGLDDEEDGRGAELELLLLGVHRLLG